MWALNLHSTEVALLSFLGARDELLGRKRKMLVVGAKPVNLDGKCPNSISQIGISSPRNLEKFVRYSKQTLAPRYVGMQSQSLTGNPGPVNLLHCQKSSSESRLTTLTIFGNRPGRQIFGLCSDLWFPLRSVFQRR